MDKEDLLTSDMVKTLFHYNEATGEFTAKVRVMGRGTGKVGSLTDQGYHIIRINYKRYFAHRLAWLYYYGDWPVGQIDHINGNRSDNRIINLREVSPRENASNKRQHREGKLIGATYNKVYHNWQACIRWKGHNKSLGYYSTQEEAHQVYMKARERIDNGEPPLSDRELSGHLIGAYYDKARDRWFTMVPLDSGKYISVQGFSNREEAHAGYLRLMGAEDKKTMAEQMRAEIREERRK